MCGIIESLCKMIMKDLTDCENDAQPIWISTDSEKNDYLVIAMSLASKKHIILLSYCE